jgi:Flp pilus assembly protein protease CpaA
MTGAEEPIIQVGVTLWLLACAVFDIRKARVPNGLSIPMLGLSLGVACWQGGDRLIFFLIAGFVFIPVWAFGGLGGGDVKVFIALAGLWPTAFLAALAASAIWAVFQGLRHGKKKSYIGIPPAALACLLVLGVEKFLFWMGSKQGG